MVIGYICIDLIFVDDLPAVVDHAHINMQADDSDLDCRFEDLQSIQNALQSDFCQVQDCLQANTLKLEVSKS